MTARYEPLLIENCFSEIAAVGPLAQAAAISNLGIPPQVTIVGGSISTGGILSFNLSNDTTVSITGTITGDTGPGYSAAVINSSGHLVLTGVDGTSTAGTHDLGSVIGEPGSPGIGGSGFSDASINSSGHLLLTQTIAGSVVGALDLGAVVGTNGTNGETGLIGPGFSGATINSSGHLILTATSAGGSTLGPIDLGNVVGTNGTNGINGTNGSIGLTGNGYTGATINVSGHLLLSATVNGVVTGIFDVGNVVGPQGPSGTSTISGATDAAITSPTNHQALVYNGTDWVNKTLTYAELPTEVLDFPLSFIIQGKPNAAQTYNLIMGMAITIPIGLTGTFSYAGVVSAGSSLFVINKISGGTTTAIAGILLSASSHTANTLFCTTAVTFAAGDVFQLVAPASQDATLSDIGITILSTKI